MHEAVKEHRIHVLDVGVRFACRENEFILEAMRRARCGPIQCGCFGGGCGVCKMRIVSGPHSVEKRMSAAHVSRQEQKEGIVLICCVKPCGDLTIERIADET